SESCGACDLCLGETEDVSEGTVVAQKILSCVYRLNQSWGVGQVISVLRGENTEKVRERRHDSLSTFAILKGCSRNELRDLIWQLIGQGFLEQSGDDFPVLRLTQRSRAVLRGEEDVRLRQPMASKKRPAKARLSLDGPVDASLFQTLREWRRSEADERGVPPYIIFSDRTLREIARAKPSTLTQLRAVYGVGDAKLEAFGSAVLAVVTASA
ncbi:MAG TPA: RQC domain-containing protein, partial [Thermoanaerobaculia bacterium]